MEKQEMNFTISTKEFADALRIASVAVTEGGRTLPILGNIKIEAKDNQVILSTTNLDLYVIQKLPAKVSKEGATTAPYSILAQLVNRMRHSSIAIAQVKNEILFTSGDVTANFETLDAAEFPPTFQQDRTSPVDCDAGDFVKPLTLLAHAMSDDARRYIMQGIGLSSSDNGTDFAATNAARLVTYAGISLSKNNAILPAQFVHAILKIEPEGKIQVIITPEVVTVISERVEISSKLIEGSYPNWRQAVPEQSDTAFSCGREDLIDALKTCAIFTERQTPGLNITGKGKEIEVSQPGKAKQMVLGTELAGQPKITIRLNSKWLAETLGVFSGDNVRIQCKDGNSPVLIEEGPLRAVINRMIPQ